MERIEHLLCSYFEEHKKREAAGEVSRLDRIEVLTLELFAAYCDRHFEWVEQIMGTSDKKD